jgi:hypothetical protein
MEKKPWYAFDIQAFLAIGIVSVCAAALFVRMFHSSIQDDKMLDTMITILFSTCLVTVYNYTFGSSSGSRSKDDTLNRIALAPPSATVPPVSTTTTVTPGSTITEVQPTPPVPATPIVTPVIPTRQPGQVS